MSEGHSANSLAAKENDVAEDLWTAPHNEMSHELENSVTVRKTAALEARERRLDDAALAKGFVVSKAQSVEQDGRYIIVGHHPVKMIRTSRNAAFPYSFSLEEAEAYLAR
jgi:hypothetical protein